jgi:hypothetical protein
MTWRSREEWPDADLTSPVKTLRAPGPLRHHPDQTPRQRFLERLAGEDLLCRRVPCHDPARVFGISRAIAAAVGELTARDTPHVESAAFERRIDAGIRHGAGAPAGSSRGRTGRGADGLTTVARCDATPRMSGAMGTPARAGCDVRQTEAARPDDPSAHVESPRRARELTRILG